LQSALCGCTTASRHRIRQVCSHNCTRIPRHMGHLGFMSCSPHPGRQHRLASVSLAADVHYAPRPRNVMDIYSPCTTPATRSRRASDVNQSKGCSEVAECNGTEKPAPFAPVVLFVHGGVWATGSKWHYSQMATRLAQAGCVVCVMEYSLYPDVRSDCMVLSPQCMRGSVSGAQ
jgi:acetyl esterase/lipase